MNSAAGGAARIRILAWLGSGRAQLSLAAAAYTDSAGMTPSVGLRAPLGRARRQPTCCSPIFYYERSAADDRRRVFEHNTAAAERQIQMQVALVRRIVVTAAVSLACGCLAAISACDHL